MLSDPQDAPLQAVIRWAKACPPDSVAVAVEEEPTGEYGPAVVVRCAPTHQSTCPLVIRVLRNGACGFELDLWSRLAARLGVQYSRLGVATSDFVALYREPSSVISRDIVSVASAVAGGRVRLRLGMIRGRIVASQGSITVNSGPYAVHGVGGSLLMCSVLGLVGCGGTRTVQYEAWY